MNQNEGMSGRVQKAPESFLSKDGIKTVFAEARGGRRDFIRSAFAAAAAGAAAPLAMAQGNPVPHEGGDPYILELPEHAKGLGLGVATDPKFAVSRWDIVAFDLPGNRLLAIDIDRNLISRTEHGAHMRPFGQWQRGFRFDFNP